MHDTVKWIQGAVRPVGGVEAGSLDMDYLIGLGKATWHPVRCERAKQGGDLWIWDNKIGSCLGGSHTLIGSYHKRSIHLYTVLKSVAVEGPLLE